MLVLDDYEESEEEKRKREEEQKLKEEAKRKKKEEKKKQKEEAKKQKEEERKQREAEEEQERLKEEIKEEEPEEIAETKKIEEVKKESKPKKEKKVISEEKVEEIKKEEKVEEKVKVKKEKPKSHKFRNFMIFLIFLMLAGAATLGLLYLISPYKLELNGDKEINVSYGSVYEEKGAVLKRFIFVSSKTVETSGEVDTTKPGDYKITYTANSISTTRIIHVIDNEAPEILFDEEEPFILNVNGNLEDLQVNAFDKYDEDIDDVEIEGNVDITKLGEYELTYKACDSSLNCSTKTRKIIVKDTEAPVITITKGDITLQLGKETYQEYGATAEDNYDDALKDIKIEEKVDSNKEGTYEVKYSICDSSDNCSEAVRKVIVKKIDILNGSFKSSPEIDGTLPAELVLDGLTKEAVLTINYCEGMGDITGSYSVSGNKLNIKLDHNWYDDSSITLTIVNDNKLSLDTDFMACAPRQNEIFTRV